jgi:uncharacterized protein (TIGR03084 family)
VAGTMTGTSAGASVVAGLVADLAQEHADLVALLEGQPEEVWSRPTPAPRWTVHDQVAHLAHFDWVTRTAITDHTAFTRLRDAVGDYEAGLQAYVDSIGPANASRDGADMLVWWTRENQRLRDAVLSAPERQRVPWFGPSMSLASKVTARIMETWAHGQDVADALGVRRAPTDRLRHVARIGVLAMPNSFATHGLDVPADPIRVALTSPSGSTWEWGAPDASSAVTGAAEDFCLVVTQRRHVSDTDLDVQGPAARAWIEVAQAFAGPPGAGRRPGEFGGTVPAATGHTSAYPSGETR